MCHNKKMDAATTTLIISQTITFFLLIISEILPFADLPYNGILQTFIDILRQTVAAQVAAPTEMMTMDRNKPAAPDS